MASTIAIERSPIRRIVPMGVAAFVAAGAITAAVMIARPGEQAGADKAPPAAATQGSADYTVPSGVVAADQAQKIRALTAIAQGRLLQPEWRSGYYESLSTVEMGRLQADWRGGGYVEKSPSTIEMGKRLAQWR